MNKASEKVIERIKKLLELATSPNEAEAKLAMEQAQKLMARHSVNMSDLNDSDEIQIVTESYENPSAFAKQGILEQTSSIISTIAPIFGVQAFVKLRQQEIRSFNLVGYPTNIKVAKYAIDAIIQQGIVEARQKYKEYRTTTFGVSFWSGFASGLYRKFSPYRDTSNGLVVYNKVKQWIDENTSGNHQTRLNQGIAYNAGFDAGQRAQIRSGLEAKNEGKLLS